jgi:hypothetical protein
MNNYDHKKHLEELYNERKTKKLEKENKQLKE